MANADWVRISPMPGAPRDARIQLVHEKGQAGDKLRPQPVTWIEIELLGDGSPSLASSVKREWVEIALVGEDDEPLGGVRYELELPDGTVRKGTLGDDGVVRAGGLDAGECKIRFPELDQEAWEFVAAADGEAVAAPAAAPKGEDYPLAGEKYRVVLPDGSVREGTLEVDGVVRFEGIPRGPCQVSFPELDQDAWEEDEENPQAAGGSAS